MRKIIIVDLYTSGIERIYHLENISVIQIIIFVGRYTKSPTVYKNNVHTVLRRI